MGKVVVLYDRNLKDNDKKWLSDQLRTHNLQLIEIGTDETLSGLLRNGFISKIKFSYYFIKQICSAFMRSKANDVMICWNFWTGLIVNFISLLPFFHRYVVSINWLSPPEGRTILYRLERCAAKNPRCIKVTNDFKAISCWRQYLGDESIQFTVLPDVYQSDICFERPVFNEESYCFAGGMNNRDWRLINQVANKLPNILFKCVALKKDWDGKVESKASNVDVLFNTSSNEYYSIMKGARLVLLPLVKDQTSGLINIIRSAQYGKICLVSNFSSTAQYYPEACKDMLIDNSVDAWCDSIAKYYGLASTEYLEESFLLQNYIRSNFSPEEYVNRLVKMISTLS